MGTGRRRQSTTTPTSSPIPSNARRTSARAARSHDPTAAGAACAEAGGTRCDGLGACVGCLSVADCAPGAICAGGACVAPSCADGVKNGTEVDVDCGGPACAKCDTTKACTVNSDCKSGLCAAGTCATTDPIITAISPTGHDRFFNLIFDAAGNILTVGVSTPAIDATTDFSTIVARFSPAGVLDPTFGTNGVFTKNLAVGTNGELARAIGLQSNGKIVVAATVEHLGAADVRDRDVAVTRLNADGTLDTTFGTNGVAIIDLSAGLLVGNSSSPTASGTSSSSPTTRSSSAVARSGAAVRTPTLPWSASCRTAPSTPRSAPVAR